LQELYPGTPNNPAVALAPGKPFVVIAVGGGEVNEGVLAVGDVDCGEES